MTECTEVVIGYDNTLDIPDRINIMAKVNASAYMTL